MRNNHRFRQQVNLFCKKKNENLVNQCFLCPVKTINKQTNQQRNRQQMDVLFHGLQKINSL